MFLDRAKVHLNRPQASAAFGRQWPAEPSPSLGGLTIGRMGTMDGVFAAARGIRPYLRDLVGSFEAVKLDEDLANLLGGGARSNETAQHLRDVLGQRVETQMFLDA